MSASTGLYFSPDLQALHWLGHLSPAGLWFHPFRAPWGRGETMIVAQRPSFWSGCWSQSRGTQVPLFGLCVHAKLLSHVQLFVTPGTVACQAPLSMGFSRGETWSGLPFLSPAWTLAFLLTIKFSFSSPILVTETLSLSPVETSAEFPVQHFHSEYLHFFLWGRQDFSKQSGGDPFEKFLFIDYAGSPLLLPDFL